MDLIEAQTLLSYLKGHQHHLHFHLPRLEHVIEWCDNRVAFQGTTLRGADPEPALVDQTRHEVTVLIDRVKTGRRVPRFVALQNTPLRQGPHIKHRRPQRPIGCTARAVQAGTPE